MSRLHAVLAGVCVVLAVSSGFAADDPGDGDKARIQAIKQELRAMRKQERAIQKRLQGDPAVVEAKKAMLEAQKAYKELLEEKLTEDPDGAALRESMDALKAEMAELRGSTRTQQEGSETTDEE